MLSPYAPRGSVDHRTYDHTSILRFIEWRFLGAPAEGPSGQGWWLTKRDRYARNIGRALRAEGPDPDLDIGHIPDIPVVSGSCPGNELSGLPPVGLDEVQKHVFELALDSGFFERVGFRIDLRPLPSL